METLDNLFGRSAPAAGEVLVLEEGDLPRLTEGRPAERQPLVRLRHKHHALARALASGLSETEAGIVAGYTVNVVSTLLTDPAFSELVRFYQSENSKAFNAMHEALANVSMAAIEEIQRRLDEEPEKISLNTLREIAQTGADRTGHGPTSTQQVNVNIGLADRMAAAQKRLEATRVTYSEKP